jgi:hypothetical protein
MKCQHCGSEGTDNRGNCVACGAPLEEVPKEEPRTWGEWLREMEHFCERIEDENKI